MLLQLDGGVPSRGGFLHMGAVIQWIAGEG